MEIPTHIIQTDIHRPVITVMQSMHHNRTAPSFTSPSTVTKTFCFTHYRNAVDTIISHISPINNNKNNINEIIIIVVAVIIIINLFQCWCSNSTLYRCTIACQPLTARTDNNTYFHILYKFINSLANIRIQPNSQKKLFSN